MTYTQRKEEELKKQIIPQTMESDFEAFWENAVAKLRKKYGASKFSFGLIRMYNANQSTIHEH